MKRSTCLIALLALCLLAGAADAANMPGRIRAGNYDLTLNGSGSRSKSFIQLYVGGLYLEQKSNNAEAVIAADAPMAIRIEITSIFVTQAKMVEALAEGFQHSTRGDTGGISREIQAFRQCFAEDISRGDIFDIVYMPSVGVVVAKNGQRKGVVPGLDFKQALFGIWLCNQPADANLKKGMLGN